jgi:hypothetical protein
MGANFIFCLYSHLVLFQGLPFDPPFEKAALVIPPFEKGGIGGISEFSRSAIVR